MKYVLVGKIVNTHGLKGEIRILSDFIYKDKVFKEGNNIYIGPSKTLESISSYRHHKNYEMICIKGINNINDVLKYKRLYVFVNKEDIKLDKNEYLDEDLIGLKVICNNKEIGIIKKIERYSKNILFLVNNSQKDFYIPYNFDIIKEINLQEKIIIIDDIKGMI